jgi:hypothetical protein
MWSYSTKLDTAPPPGSFQTVGPPVNYIRNRAGTVILPEEPGLLEWLQTQYPFSQYHVVEASDAVVS